MLRKILRLCVLSIIVLLIVGAFCFYHIKNTSKPYLFDNAAEVPPCRAAIVLGTSRHLKSGLENLFFTYRIDAAEKLFKAGKARVFILSGDNRRNDYNEPQDMKDALMERGIPDSCLVLDYAGLRTFDSMVRCKEVFGQDSVIVVSQQFHNERAVFISQKTALVAFGFNAKQVTTQRAFKTRIREFFSRIKCVLDFYILNTQPKHLGEKILIK